MTLTLGEGPGVDAVTGGPAFAGDLTSAQCAPRWPAFAPAAVDTGATTVFALPLFVGGIRLGVMDLYRARPGPLHHDEIADALLLADTACARCSSIRFPTSNRTGADASRNRPDRSIPRCIRPRA